MSGLCYSQNGSRRLQVSHLTHQNHIRVLPQGMLQGLGKAEAVAAYLALCNGRPQRRMHILDRVFNSKYMAHLVGINVMHHGRQGGALTTPCRT